jgi:DnaJ-class molecular chaperone
MTKTTKIVLCSKCEGWGYTTHEECVDYHKCIYETRKTECIRCNGNGTMIEITEVTYKSLPKKT